jgi:hypothetical protein
MHLPQAGHVQSCLNLTPLSDAAGRPVTSPLTGAEMGSNLNPNLFIRSLVRQRKKTQRPGAGLMR